MTHRVPLGLLALLILAGTGCLSESERVAEVAREAAREQAEQNKRMARVQQEVAEAHKRLVEGEAKARSEMVALERDIQGAQAEVGVQRDALEAERRQMAAERGRDPIIASAIQCTWVLLACLLPLLLSIYVLRALRDSSDNGAAVTEILIQDLTSDEPTFLPPARPLPALKHEAGPGVPDRALADQ